jgi:hypothetical protein
LLGLTSTDKGTDRRSISIAPRASRSPFININLSLTINLAPCAGGRGDSARSFWGEIRLGEQGKKCKPQAIIFDECSEYREAKGLASEIAKRDRLHEDVIFSDAMHVAVTLALEDEGMSYTRPNVAWMFDRIRPEEVRDILLLRRNHPDDYKSLPMAGATESLSSAEIEAAAELAKKLTPEQLDAFFFSDRTGRA